MIDAATASVFETLTAKQRQAMALAADGLTSKEIARELDISPHSVDKRIDAVRGRLDARPRSQIVRPDGCTGVSNLPIWVLADVYCSSWPERSWWRRLSCWSLLRAMF